MKKALSFVLFTVVLMFNTWGFVAIGQGGLTDKEIPSVVSASDEVVNKSNDTANASVAGIEADKSISVTYFPIMISLLVLMLLFKTKNN